MKLTFQPTKTIGQCFDDAHAHIETAKQNGSGAVADLNPLGFRNRVTEYAALFYIRDNWKKTDHITCPRRADHYGVEVGTTMDRTVHVGDLKDGQYLKILKDARAVAVSRPLETFA